MQKLRTYISRIVTHGIRPELGENTQQHCRNTQALSLSFLLGIIPFLAVFSYLGLLELVWLNLAVLGIALVNLYLGWRGLHHISSFGILISLNLAALLNQSFLGPEVSLQLVFCIFIILPVWVLEARQSNFILLFQVMAVLSYLILSADLFPYIAVSSGLTDYLPFINMLLDWVILLGFLFLVFLIYLNHQDHLRSFENVRKQFNLFRESKSRFLSTLSHKIRTPLNALLGVNELMSKTKLNAEQEEYNQIIKMSSEKLFSIVNEVIDSSQVEFGKLELDKRSFKLADILSGIHESMAIRTQKRGLSFNLKSDRVYAESLIGDPERLRQVLTNLLDHAIKFTFQGGIELRVLDKGIDADFQRIYFEVSDTGIGIPEDQISQLFEPDSKLEAPLVESGSYTRLGLALSGEIIRIMGGGIQVESQSNQGSRFFFELDFAKDSGTYEVSQPGSSATSLSPIPSHASHILLVEDNMVNQKIIARILEKAGYKVQTVGDGQAAVDAFQDQDYALVLMDLGLPVLNGLEATRIILDKYCSSTDSRKPCPIVIALTANTRAEDRQQCLDAGMKDFLSKPVRSTDLQSLIQRWYPSEWIN